MGNSALKRVQANCLISGFDPGSCPPNWLQGKARISNPENKNCIKPPVAITEKKHCI